MKNKTLGIGLIISLGISLFTIIFENVLDFYTVEALYTIAGLGFLFFGIWGGIRLINN